MWKMSVSYIIGEGRSKEKTSMVKKIVSLILVAGIISAMGSSGAKKREIIPLSDVTHIEDNRYSCTFDDIEHEFILCLPDKTKDAPLVLMLHGAGESADAMRRTTEFDEMAVPEGYAVCYVDGAVDKASTSPIKGWNAGTADGENRDTEFLVSLATYLENEYKLDTGRTFVAGFSYGGFMSYRLAVEAPYIFEAIVSVAGVMPLTMWDKKNERSDVGIFQISGSNDDIIPRREAGSSGSAIAPPIEDVISYWAEAEGLDLLSEETVGNNSTLTRYGSGDKEPQVWHLLVDNGYHSWPSESITGIDTNSLILEFLNMW